MDSYNSTQYASQVSWLQGPFAIAVIVFAIVISLIWIIAIWKIFVKAGKPGWAGLIPFYNLYVLVQIIQKPGWWFVLCLIPYINLVMSLLLALGLSKAFGKSTVFGVIFLWLFPIGYLILAFDKSTYTFATSPTSQPQVAAVPDTTKIEETKPS